MKVERAFRLVASRDEILERLPGALEHRGFKRVPGAPLSFQRGSWGKSLVSLKVEDWPTHLRVAVMDVDEGAVGVVLYYNVKTGHHLVGTLDRLALRTEAFLIEEELMGGRRRSLDVSMAPIRRPTYVAALLNMLLAIGIVVWAGRIAQFPLHYVIPVALAVAFLDGLVIHSFADMLAEGLDAIPRERGGVMEHTGSSPTSQSRS